MTLSRLLISPKLRFQSPQQSFPDNTAFQSVMVCAVIVCTCTGTHGFSVGLHSHVNLCACCGCAWRYLGFGARVCMECTRVDTQCVQNSCFLHGSLLLCHGHRAQAGDVVYYAPGTPSPAWVFGILPLQRRKLPYSKPQQVIEDVCCVGEERCPMFPDTLWLESGVSSTGSCLEYLVPSL